MDTLEVERANESGGSGSSRQYARVGKGSENGGQFAPTNTAGSSSGGGGPIYKPRAKKGGGGSGQPGLAASSKFKTLGPGEDNDPQAVAEMQQLLTALGLGNLEANGQFDGSTAQAVMEAQKRLGMKPTGKANKALVNKLLNAYDLSPCVKRSEDPDPSDLIRSDPLCEFTVTRSEDDVYDTLRASVDDEDLDEPVARAYTNPREPEPEPDEPAPPTREILRYDRRWELDDIEIVRGGSGREVTAYAAIFDTPAEIKDQHGHYVEVISRSAFNRAISHGTDRVGFYYHHGMTLAGTPSDLGSVPIGSPVEIRADNKGLRTVSRFNKSQLADSVLEAIRAGDIKGYSFRGRIFQSTPNRVPRTRSGDLPTITRTELGLTEYGPTPTPYYAGAGIVAIRSAQQVAEALAHLDEQTRHELLRIIRTSGYPAPTPSDPDADHYATPSQGPGAEDSPAQALRSAEELLALQATAAEILTRSRKL